jgi:hypothetical protein
MTDKAYFVRGRRIRSIIIVSLLAKTPKKSLFLATFGPWVHIASVINNKIALKNEPTGLHLEYWVKAVNKGG